MTKKPWTFSIDIVGTCNLRCPSCPVGNNKHRNPVGLMPFELFKEILDKIESNEEIAPKIDLYNWGEPSLHKQLPEFIEDINRRGWFSNISSNLNIPNIERLLEVPPAKIRLSVSGYVQSRYGVTHERGEIDLVKSNWHKLVHLKKKRGALTTLEVAFHLYKDNKEDLLRWAALAAQSGSAISPVWSLYQPLEDLVGIALGEKPPDAYHEIADKMEVSPIKQMEIGRIVNPSDCRLRQKQTAINFDGSVALCCGVYDMSKFTIAKSFLDVEWEELQRRKYEHEFCGKCFKAGGPGTIDPRASRVVDEVAVASQIDRGELMTVSIADGIKVQGKIDTNKLFFSNLDK